MVKTIGRLVDLTGQKFGRLTVKHRTKDVIVCGQELKKGKTISCGCRWQGNERYSRRAF